MELLSHFFAFLKGFFGNTISTIVRNYHSLWLLIIIIVNHPLVFLDVQIGPIKDFLVLIFID
jgi:hypothetical protein